MERDALNGEGLYSNTTQIAEHPDEALDELFGVEVYNVACSLQPYHSELSRYGVTGVTLGKQFTRYLFEYLKRIADHIKANTDKPEAVKAYILEAITNLDNMPVWGLIYQILILQGLLVMFANCTLTEGDRGYIEAQCLVDWIADLLADKVMWFAMSGGVMYGDGDKERLQPLCDYLYNTEMGRCVQDCIFDRTQPEADHRHPDTSTPTDSPEVVSLPDELNTPEALKIFEQAREIGLISQDFQWLKGLQLLACFAREMSLKLGLGKGLNSDGSPRVSWKPFERLFKHPQGKLRANYNDILKTGQEPSDIELIDTIFK